MSLQRCEGTNLESVLEEVRARFGDTATIVEANRLRKGGVGGFFARERFEVVVDIDEDDPFAALPTEVPAEYGVEATEDFCERLLSMADDVSDRDEPARPGPATPSVSTEQPEFAAILGSITRHMDGPTLPPAQAIDARALARVGLPEDIRRRAASGPAPLPGTDPSDWLTGLLDGLPVAPPLPQGRGSVIVVAGPREAALLLARQITAELGLDPDGLVFASPGYRGRAIPVERRVTTVEEAAEARSSWRRRARPTVVAIDAPTGQREEWARQVIDALEPTAVWGAVDATRKPEDLFEWAEQLGGFDALGVSNLDNTVSPAAVLRCGIPVGRLDGRPATPLQWASLLVARLAS
ncbi:MAG TPA: hypothetical protein VFW57_07830 [Acidimicrobiia bacterium]|nr:hypothetical protein [Acidimicrobiia bacterium]